MTGGEQTVDTQTSRIWDTIPPPPSPPPGAGVGNQKHNGKDVETRVPWAEYNLEQPVCFEDLSQVVEETAVSTLNMMMTQMEALLTRELDRKGFGSTINPTAVQNQQVPLPPPQQPNLAFQNDQVPMPLPQQLNLVPQYNKAQMPPLQLPNVMPQNHQQAPRQQQGQPPPPQAPIEHHIYRYPAREGLGGRQVEERRPQH